MGPVTSIKQPRGKQQPHNAYREYPLQNIQKETDPQERLQLERLREYFKRDIQNIVTDSGLFDEEFYTSNYQEDIGPDENPWQHFLNKGLDSGFRPSKRFDPVLYKILKFKESGSVEQLLEQYSNNEDKDRLKFDSTNFQKIIPHFSDINITPKLLYDSHLDVSQDDFKKNVEHAARFSEKGETTFSHANNTYKLIIPEPQFFLNKILKNEPFAAARLPHGFWDYLSLIKDVEKNFSNSIIPGLLNEAELESITVRFLGEHFPNLGAIKENFTHEVLDKIDSNKEKKNFFTAIAFKGYPTWDNRLFLGNKNNPESSRQIKHFTEYFNPDDEIYDATLWKRWVISGALKGLPDLCRSRQVFLVGPQQFSDLGRRWELSRFTHIKIPDSNTHAQRHVVLKRAIDSIEGVTRDTLNNHSNPAPIVLFQCGGSLAFWSISRLFEKYPGIYFIDMGQALDGWYMDQDKIRSTIGSRLYGLQIIENLNSDGYYTNLLGDDYKPIQQELKKACSKLRRLV
jgi:hypothetical protein